MPFTALFLAHAPDADPALHRSTIETGVYTIHTVVVPDLRQAIDVCTKMAAEQGVQSVLLCPGHSNRDVAAIADAVGEGVGVSVARGDPQSGRVAAKAMEEAGFLAAAPRG
jgi:hypothetical protein